MGEIDQPLMVDLGVPDAQCVPEGLASGRGERVGAEIKAAIGAEIRAA